MSDTDTQAKLELVRLSYLASLQNKRDAIHENWQQLAKSWTPENFDALYIILHGIAGSAETFGLPEVTQEARELVDKLKLLSKSSPPEQATQDNLAHGLDNFLTHLDTVHGR
jgi:HPt (histidine-containing phosphotransfer) domain-containing protein